MKPWSKTTRNRLLWLASLLDRRATAIRRLVKARTPPRKAKAPKPRDDRQVDIEQEIAARNARIAARHLEGA